MAARLATKPAALSGCLEEDSRACVRTRPASMKKKGTHEKPHEQR